jgi:cell division septation protein DedD
MSTDVSKAIHELLFEKNAVIVPGLGGFTSMPTPATVDYVQDIITPPAAKLDFNPNLVLNDGVLVQYLQKTNISTYQEAENMVERFVANVRETLERREIFEIPKVGRLYQDYEQKIRFMPEGTNFNASSFGLPIVEFQPLVKEKPKSMTTPPKQVSAAEAEFLESEQAAAASAAAAAVADQPPGSLTMKMLPWLVLLLAILLALGIYAIFGGQKDKAIADQPDAVERVNVKPSLPEESNTTSSTSGASTATQQPGAPAQKSTPPTETTVPDGADTEADKYEPTKNTLYMVVHSFGVKSNATNFARKLTEDGYATETRKNGKLYRVGVSFAYSTNADIEKMRSELAKKYQAGPKTEKELEEMGQ